MTMFLNQDRDYPMTGMGRGVQVKLLPLKMMYVVLVLPGILRYPVRFYT